MWNNIKSLLKSFIYAFNGIITAIKTQRNFRIHIIAAIYVFSFSMFYNFSVIEYVVLIFICALVLSLELINTALEHTVDICSPEYNMLAKIAKDCAAGAVLISAIGAVFIGILFFVDFEIIKSILFYYSNNCIALIGLIIYAIAATLFILSPQKNKKGKNNEYKN